MLLTVSQEMNLLLLKVVLQVFVIIITEYR